MLNISKHGLEVPSLSFETDNGAQWQAFEDPADFRRFTIFTGAGSELVRQAEGRDSLDSLMKQYRGAEIGDVIMYGTEPQMRAELGRGQEAIVYRMGPYAVREERSVKGVYNAFSELERMDAINTVIDHGLPRWLNLPVHYALHSDPDHQKTYTVMDRVNGGLTAADIMDYPNIPPERLPVVEKELGDGVEEAQARIPELYGNAYTVLADAISSAGKNPDNYLTDWAPRNVVVERFAVPVAGSDYNLNVIDQYRA